MSSEHNHIRPVKVAGDDARFTDPTPKPQILVRKLWQFIRDLGTWQIGNLLQLTVFGPCDSSFRSALFHSPTLAGVTSKIDAADPSPRPRSFNRFARPNCDVHPVEGQSVSAGSEQPG